MEFAFPGRKMRTHRQPISFMLKQAVDNPDVISLAAGLVDYDTLPFDEVRDLLGDLLTDVSSRHIALQYGTTHGLAELRRRLLDHLAELDGVAPADFGATADDIVIATGSQQLLFILSDVLLDPGDIVLTSWPSYFVYTGTLESFGAEVRGVDMDEEGMRPDALEETLRRIEDEGRLDRVKIVYVQNCHQNPTGVSLAEDRKPLLLDIVRRYSRDHRILLLEDAAYRELNYDGRVPGSIKQYDKDNQFVALLQTFSKPFAPGVKTGYALLPRELVEPVILQKGNHDFGSANLNQHLLLAAMHQGIYHRHLLRLQTQYAAKRDALLAVLAEHFGGGKHPEIQWTHPTGGLYVYLTLPKSIDTGLDGELFKQAVEEGVLYVPGEFCFGADPTRTPPHNTLRLCYAKEPTANVIEGVARLARAIEIVEG